MINKELYKIYHPNNITTYIAVNSFKSLLSILEYNDREVEKIELISKKCRVADNDNIYTIEVVTMEGDDYDTIIHHDNLTLEKAKEKLKEYQVDFCNKYNLTPKSYDITNDDEIIVTCSKDDLDLYKNPYVIYD